MREHRTKVWSRRLTASAALPLPAAGERQRSMLDNTRGKEACDYYEQSQSIVAIFCIGNSIGLPGRQPVI